MREISIVLSNIYICNKICKEVPKNKRGKVTLLKINLTLPNAKLKILLALLSLHKISEPQTTYKIP